MGTIMALQEHITILMVWTPFLLKGMVLNIVISILSVIVGTIIGFSLSKLKFLPVACYVANYSSNTITMIMRNVPSFVLLFFIAFILPREINVFETVIVIPAFVKATIALAIPVAAFVADQSNNLRKFECGTHARDAAVLAFFISWVQYFLIIFMASSTASVIGVQEIVSRANTVIAAVGENNPEIMSFIYGYVALWFVSIGGILSVGRIYLANYLQKKTIRFCDS